MAKLKTVFRCQVCGSTFPKWLGRCGDCDSWGSVLEEASAPANARAAPATLDAPEPITEVGLEGLELIPTGVPELDRVLGGGLTPGSATLLGGEPGVGKSTLALQALCRVAATGRRCLLVTAEESKQQVRSRAERLGDLPPELWLLSETAMPALLARLDEVRPEVVVVDSIQTVYDPEVPGAPGSVSQVRECANALVRRAKSGSMAAIAIGHVTKEGTLAGPRVLEHVVDTVLSFEGERHHALRVLRAHKHRFGSTRELGLFEMRGDGLRDVPDASALFLADRREGGSGSAVTAVLEGVRPLLVEVQALVAPTNAPMPRRSAQGMDGGRLALLLGVLERRARVALGSFDVYANVTGGIRVDEPAADLAVAVALASAATDRPIPSDLVVLGEVGLGGEVRQAPQAERRLAEAARLGFGRAVVPRATPAVEGMALLPVDDLGSALTVLELR